MEFDTSGTAPVRKLELVQPQPAGSDDFDPETGEVIESVPEAVVPKKKRGRPAKSAALKAGEAKQHAAKKKRRGRADQVVADAGKKLRARARSGDFDAAAVLKKIQKKFAVWNRAKSEKADIGKRCGEDLKSSEAAFANAVEAPLEVGKVELAAYRAKLENVEQRWQELSETKAANIELKKEAREAVAEAIQALNEAIEESTQPSLPFGG
jgi:hypothetical protein